MNMTLAGWDWLIIVIYFIFIFGIGFVFKHVVRNASDYFRGGGNMLWWMAGMSAVAGSISAWSFTAAAAKVYSGGIMLPLAWIISAPITCTILYFVVPRFRQMRVITSIEAVFRRFGFGTEQFYVYLILPMTLLMTGLALNTVGVFFSGALGVSVPVAMISIVTVVAVIAILGGQWAVVATDFVQGLLMFLTVMLVVFFSVNLPEVGGIIHLFEALPKESLNITGKSRAAISLGWLFFIQMMYIFYTLNLNGEGAKYLLVKDAKHARGMVLLRFVLFGVVPLNVIMLLPALCAIIVFPNIGSIMTTLKIPEEGAFLAMAFKTLPQGLMGLLICGILSAASATMDTALNRNAGYFVRNVYIKYMDRTASEERQLVMGKVFTIVFAVICILIGLSVDHLRTMNLFDLFQIVNSMLWIPSMVPTALGVIYKRTPSWSGWSTVLIGMAAGAIARILYSPALIERLLGYDSPLTKYENNDAQFVFVSLIVFVVAIAWFFFTSLFYDRSNEAYKHQVDQFFIDMKTPIDHEKEDIRNQDAMQYRLVGLVTLAMGFLILLGVLIPNAARGRYGFLFVGGVIFSIGAWLYAVSIKKYKKLPEAEH